MVTQTGNTAEWQKLVQDAGNYAGSHLDEELESYLVFLLMRYLRRPEMVQRVLALDYLHALELHSSRRGEPLQEVADQCLLLSGLFPHRAERRRVQLRYYVDLGRSAYLNLADLVSQWATLYQRMASEFIDVMDTLQGLRLMGGGQAMSLMQAAELGPGYRSAVARRVLAESTTASEVTLLYTLPDTLQ